MKTTHFVIPFPWPRTNRKFTPRLQSAARKETISPRHDPTLSADLDISDMKSDQAVKQIKVAPSFWFLNINVPIFLLKPYSNGLRKTWFKFLGISPSKCWPNSLRVFVCIAIGKSGFLKKNFKMAGDPNFFLRKFVEFNQFLRRS